MISSLVSELVHIGKHVLVSCSSINFSKWWGDKKAAFVEGESRYLAKSSYVLGRQAQITCSPLFCSGIVNLHVSPSLPIYSQTKIKNIWFHRMTFVIVPQWVK